MRRRRLKTFTTLTAEEKVEIATLYTSGKSISQLATLFVTGPAVIEKILGVKQVEVRRKIRKRRPAKKPGHRVCWVCGQEKPVNFFPYYDSLVKNYAELCEICDRTGAVRNDMTQVNRFTKADYQKLFEEQGGVCGICKRTPYCITGTGIGRPPKFHVDHNHSTGEIRGLLCVKCNTGLGHFDDDMILIKSAYKYLFEREYGDTDTGWDIMLWKGIHIIPKPDQIKSF